MARDYEQSARDHSAQQLDTLQKLLGPDGVAVHVDIHGIATIRADVLIVALQRGVMKKHIGWNHNVYGEWDDTEIDTWTWDITDAKQIADRFERETGRRPKVVRYPIYEMPDGSGGTDCWNHDGEECN